MTPFKLNWTNSIDNINELEKEIETTVKDLNDKIDLLEQENEQLEQLVEQMQEVEEKEVTITENTTTNITPSTGKYALSKVTVTTNIVSGNAVIDFSKITQYRYNLTDLVTKITDISNIPSNATNPPRFRKLF